MLLLNAFLLKRSAEPIEALTELPSDPPPQLVYWSGGSWDSLPWEDASITSAASPGDVFIVLIARVRSAPMWQEFLSREVQTLVFEEPPTSYGAIVFCAIDDVDDSSMRWVAWCFGSGSRTLQRSSQDPRFGLTIALNMIGAPKLPATSDVVPAQRHSRGPQFREMRYRTTSPYFQQTGHRAARDIPLDGFRIDRASDLIASIGGRADHSAFASSVLGGRSLRFRTDLTQLTELSVLSTELLELSRSRVYAESLRWVDNIRLIEDEFLISLVRDHLIQGLRSEPVPATIDAILPDDLLEVEDERAIRFILYPREQRMKASRHNLTIEAVASRMRNTSDPVGLLNTELRFLDDTTDLVGKVRLLDCICADMIVDEDQYLAYDGDFYKVDRDFVQRIDNELSELQISMIEFPDYNGETEPQYIERIRKQDAARFIVLDRQLIQLDGEYGIEASDLVSDCGALVHLKRKGKSSTLSHLFLQAANSCELLRRSLAARRQLAELVRSRASSSVLAQEIAQIHTARLSGNGLEVVFGFLGDWSGRSVTSLPLFSRISLVYESRKVAGLGFKPTIALIGQPENRRLNGLPSLRRRGH
jgi:uncharacterized protein (TIGR04141 family)